MANSIASSFPKLRSIFSRSKSSPRAPPKIGRKTIYSRWFAARIPIAISTRADFDEIIEMLSDGIAARRGRYGAYLHRDQVNDRLRGRRGAAWPPSPAAARFQIMRFTPWSPSPKASSSARWMKISRSRACAATSFFSEILPGAFAACKPDPCLVEDAHGAAPNIPFWRGEAPARTRNFPQQVAAIRETDQRAHRRCRASAGRGNSAASRCGREWLKQECGLDRAGAEQAVEYIVAGRAVLRAVPTQTNHHRRAFLRRERRHAAGDSRAVRRRASTKPGASLCESAFAARSISNCRPPPPTTA